MIEGKKFFIHHGDGFAYNDSGYRILKKILRSKLSQKIYSFIHPDIGIWLAKGTSETSRVHTDEKIIPLKTDFVTVHLQRSMKDLIML